MLVSRVYRCQSHNHEIIAHDCGVLKQLLDVDREPFILSHLTGMTRELQMTISSYILSGLAFSDIENILRQHLWNSLAERCKTYNLHFPNSKKLFPSNLEEDVKQIWKEPSNDFIAELHARAKRARGRSPIAK